MSTLQGITLMVDVRITQNIFAKRKIILEDYLNAQWTFPLGPCPPRLRQWLFEDTSFNQS